MIPIFRAKHYRDDIDFIGRLIGKDDEYYIIEDEDMEYYRPIDITTLAISFNDGKSFVKLSDLEIHTCTDFELKYSDMKMRARKEVQPPNGSIFTVITDKGR